MELKLNSLGGSEPVIYHWPYHFNDQGCEIIEAISFACEEEPPLTKYLDDILTGCIVSNYESMRIVCQKFNQAVDHLRSLVTSGLYEVERRASYKLLHHVIQTCYNRAVVDPDKLNHYEPFSAEVYGETSFELVHQMIETIKFSENDQFIDLGSGVGHVVLQVAASTPCKSCYGIEKAHWPAIYAKQMGAEFDKWMKFYGKECGSHELVKGNFLADDFKDVISNATVIFVNNFAFGPQVDHELKLRFSNLKEGTKIVSSKAFCALNMQITERNLSDIGAILTVEELSPLRGPVSWTPKRITYYLHTIDRTQLEDYFKMRQNPNRRQKKSLTYIGNKINRKPEINYHSKMNKNTKIWRGSTMICKQPPPTINMISTITAMDSQSIPLCSKAKKALWNDSSDSISSNNPAYIFPSAHTLVFNESNTLPNTASKPILLHGNSNADVEPVMNENDISPRKHYYFKNEATSKMGLVGKTPFSPLNPKDMFVGFCSDENDLSEELQLEIENVISLFHNETSKIAQKDGYKPSAIFNDLSILEDRTTQKDKQSEGSYSANGKKSVGVVSSSNNGDSKIENSKNQCLTPTVEMPKITVSLPRFSPITPETPTTLFESNGFKKCIPFPRLVKTNDLFVNNPFSNSVNTKACNQECVSDVPLKNVSRSTPLKPKSPSEEPKPVTPSLTPACQPVSCRPVKLVSEHGNKQLSDFDEYSHGYHSPVQSINHGKNLPVSQWDHSKVFTVSLPRKILDVSHLSTDESTPYSHNNNASNQANGITSEDEDDIDPPELTFMMNAFRKHYKHLLKSMKHPSFKSKLLEDLDFQKNHQVFLYKTIFKLNNELCELQHQNKILFQSLMEKNNRQLHSSLHEAFPSVSNSPSVLDQAICLDSSQDISTSREYFNNAQNDVKKIHFQHNLNEFEKQPPSPEMPLLLPEICSNFENEQLIQHSKFTPPRLTVCVDEPKNASYHLSNISSLPYKETNQDSVQTSPSHPICFSPISSCDTESPVQSPLPVDGEDKYSNVYDKMLPSESQLNNNIYYSSLSNPMKNDSYNPCSNIKFNNGIKVAFENSDSHLSFKKRKALEGVSDHLLTSKRLQLSGGLLSQTYESTYDNVILRNVLHSKGQSNGPYIESRSDSRDSGFGKDCETDCEAANRLRVSKDSKELVEVPAQKGYIARQNYEVSQINYQSLPIVPMTSSTTLAVGHSNLRENHYHILARNNVFKHPNNHKQVCKFPLPAVNQDGSCFSLPGCQNPKLSGSYDLSFSSLANYYERYLSQDSGAFVHDNLNNNSPNHFYLMRHNLSSAFT